MNDTIALHWIDWAIIISYIIFSLGVGIYFSKRAGKSTEEYFLSGRSLPWWLVGTSMVATTFAADTPLAITEFVRGPGIWENWFWWNGALGSLLGIFLFPGMIEDWRSRWKDEFPFYFVQIAPCRYTKDPLKNVSQKLREAQRKTLELPNTGMVVTLDIGDFDNIHPANKQDVGKRLARLALVNDYDSDLTPLGPILSESEIFKNTIKLSFTHVGSGLKYLTNEVNQFEIASSNMDFFKANVSVEENNIFVSSPFVKDPRHVRYAWSDTPIATLINGEGFPASSFKIEIK